MYDIKALSEVNEEDSKGASIGGQSELGDETRKGINRGDGAKRKCHNTMGRGATLEEGDT